jgi:hypothetical protein
MTMLPEGLRSVRDQAMDELRRADTKATTLLSLVGATGAGVIALSNRAVPPVAAVLLWTAMLPIGASVVLLLAAIRPRLSQCMAPGTWLWAAQVGPATLLASSDPNIDTDDAAVTAAASEVCTVARIAQTKFRRIGHAVTLPGCGLALLAVSLLLAAVVS